MRRLKPSPAQAGIQQAHHSVAAPVDGRLRHREDEKFPGPVILECLATTNNLILRMRLFNF